MKVSVFRSALLTMSALVGLGLVVSPSALAQTAESSEESVLSDLSAYDSDDSASQVTSVSQLSDVQPTDWAFQALQNLIARYGCIAGYPDGTYRGFTALSRYEFAAGLNACLNNITANLDQIQLNQQDIATLNRLQQQFAADLATLRGRVDSLEARTAELEANQFSTTTKLAGEVLFVPAFSIDEDEDAFDDEAIFGYRARLNFDTSFTGEDRLRTRLEAEELLDFSGDQLGFQAGGDSGGSFEIDDLIYSFPLGPVDVVVGASGLDIDNDYSDTISPLDSSGSGALSEFADPRQYEQAFPGSGAGLGASFAFIDNDDITLSLDAGYVADDPESPEPEEGLFNGDYAASAQLTFLSNFFDAGLMYSNSYATSASEFDQGDTYDLGGIGATEGNTFGGQFNFKLGDTFEIGGGIAYTDFNPRGGDEDNFEMWSYQGTIAVNDLINDGDLLGILVGVPSYTRDLEGQTDETSVLAEVFYRYRLNDNIDITPAVIVNTDPFNVDDNDATVIGAIRTRFRF